MNAVDKAEDAVAMAVRICDHYEMGDSRRIAEALAAAGLLATDEELEFRQIEADLCNQVIEAACLRVGACGVWTPMCRRAVSPEVTE